jgi:hypothetical protein
LWLAGFEDVVDVEVLVCGEGRGAAAPTEGAHAIAKDAMIESHLI